MNKEKTLKLILVGFIAFKIYSLYLVFTGTYVHKIIMFQKMYTGVFPMLYEVFFTLLIITCYLGIFFSKRQFRIVLLVTAIVQSSLLLINNVILINLDLLNSFGVGAFTGESFNSFKQSQIIVIFVYWIDKLIVLLLSAKQKKAAQV